MYLVTSSSTETVHIFRLSEPVPEPLVEDQQQGWMSYLGKALSGPASYLPTQVGGATGKERLWCGASELLPSLCGR